jgi:Bacterial alpha-L-rhamnosidase 6 hairpin glycosidase domain
MTAYALRMGASVRSLAPRSVWALRAAQNVPPGADIQFDSSDRKLVDGFNWAKAEALSYAHSDGPIGPWYEAALPERNAFCMRDVSHMSTGAHLLGLSRHNHTMLRQFALHVSASKKWASWWEITSGGDPAPVDYKSDADFWYCLPANFDVLNACYRQWLWSRDPAYVDDQTFLDYYRATVTSYVDAWDSNHDGLLEHLAADGHRGIATYDEDLQNEVMVAADLVAAQYAAYRDYAAIARSRKQDEAAGEFDRKARALKSLYNTKWWNDARGEFYGALSNDGKFHSDLKTGSGASALSFPLYFGIVENGTKTAAAIARLERRVGLNSAAQTGMLGGVEGLTYLADIFYMYGRSQSAYRVLKTLIDPGLKRRTYPEVSFTVIGNVGAGLMGICPMPDSKIETFPRLTAETAWAEIQQVPVGTNRITVRHEGCESTRFENLSGSELSWRASFPSRGRAILVDGKEVLSNTGQRPGGITETWCNVTVAGGRAASAHLIPA